MTDKNTVPAGGCKLDGGGCTTTGLSLAAKVAALGKGLEKTR